MKRSNWGYLPDYSHSNYTGRFRRTYTPTRYRAISKPSIALDVVSVAMFAAAIVLACFL